MKKFIYFIESLALGIVDGYVLFNTLYFHYYSFQAFLFIHLLVMGIHYYTGKYFHKGHYSVDSHILFLPSIGLITFSIVNFLASDKKRAEIMENYQGYIAYVTNLERLKDINTEAEINTISVEDNLRFSSDQAKKEAVVNFKSDETAVKVRILRKALKDKNQEVVHYAASTINLMEEEIERKISKLKGEYSYSGELEKLEELAIAFDDYCNSGLIEGEVRHVFLQEYLEVLFRLAKRKGKLYSIELNVAKTYKNLKQPDQALKVLKALVKKHKKKPEPYLLLMEIYYQLKDSSSLGKIAKQVKELDVKVSENEKGIIEYWSDQAA